MSNDPRVRRLTNRTMACVAGFARFMRSLRLLLCVLGAIVVAWVLWRVM